MLLFVSIVLLAMGIPLVWGADSTNPPAGSVPYLQVQWISGWVMIVVGGAGLVFALGARWWVNSKDPRGLFFRKKG